MPIDLVPSTAGYDANGFMIDPWWRVQLRARKSPRNTPDSLPNVSRLCEGFRDRLVSAAKCTSQAAFLEFIASKHKKHWWVPDFAELCPGDPDHVNWRVSRRPPAQSATVMTGRIYFGQTAPDGDLNLFLVTPGDPARTAHDPEGLSTHGGKWSGRMTELEFLRREFSSDSPDPWWRALREALRAGAVEPFAISDSIDGREAVVLGIYGVDGVHGMHSEIHPVMGLAIRTVTDGPVDHWQVFARNWGSEGTCSNGIQSLTLPNDTLHLWLPWRAGADSARVTLRAGQRSIPPFTVTDSPLHVPFRLASPDRRDKVEGRVEIVWYGTVRRGKDPLPGGMERRNVVPNVEEEHERKGSRPPGRPDGG
ncbi:MAG: hypothetical protein ACJ8GN_21685 [Longimicrobiaceae bacterium]